MDSRRYQRLQENSCRLAERTHSSFTPEHDSTLPFSETVYQGQLHLSLPKFIRYPLSARRTRSGDGNGSVGTWNCLDLMRVLAKLRHLTLKPVPTSAAPRRICVMVCELSRIAVGSKFRISRHSPHLRRTLSFARAFHLAASFCLANSVRKSCSFWAIYFL